MSSKLNISIISITAALLFHISICAISLPIQFILPKPAYVSLVLNDSKGNRIRNLVAEKKMDAGKQEIAWDGLDDSGKPVAPGKYRWCGLYRDELKLEYQFSVYTGGAKLPWFTAPSHLVTDTGWLSDHNPACSIATVNDKIFIGAIVSENGQDLMALDINGNKLWGRARPSGSVGASVLTADDKFVYGAGEAQWGGDNAYVYRIDPQTYQTVNIWHHKGRLGLRGIAIHDGKVYVSSDLEEKIFVIDAAKVENNQQVLREIALPQPGGLAFTGDGKLLAISGKTTVIIRDDGTSQPLITTDLNHPNRMVIGNDGTIYISDGPTSWNRDNDIENNALYGKPAVRITGDNQIKVFNADGKFIRAIGDKGGRKPGPYNPQAMRCPVGLALDKQNRLWVTEWDMLPKRISVWNPQNGKLITEYIGAHKYGGGGALDPGDRTQMIYDGMLFKLDWDKGTWKLTDTLVDIMNADVEDRHSFGGYSNWPTRIVRYKGQQYFIGGPSGVDGSDMGGTIWKRVGKTFQPIAYIGPFNPGFDKNNVPNSNHYLYKRMLEQVGDKPPGFGQDAGWPPNKWQGHISYLMIWADANNDGIVQPEEVHFYDKPHWWLYQAQVASDMSIYLRQPSHRNITSVWRLPLSRIDKNGVPQYDITKIETIAEKLPDTTGGSSGSFLPNSTGKVFVMSRPIWGIDPKTKTTWQYPNGWPMLGDGSPRPQPGLIVGGYGMKGVADVGGEVGSVLAINSNFGQWYLLTDDGIFVSTLFGDTRTSPFWGTYFKEAKRGMNVQGISLGQESFSGSIGRTSDGNIYIIAGHPHCSIIKVVGLESIKRLLGNEIIIDEMITGKNDADKTISIPLRLKPHNWQTWGGDSTTIIKSGDVEVARVWLSYDGNNIYTRYKVTDASPLQNAGGDNKLLFKTGDSVDLQIGLDYKSDNKHTIPANGDVRLLMTKTKDGAIGVLYRYKVANTQNPERFWSPTGEVSVDKIEYFTAKDLSIESSIDKDGYTISAIIPWKTLYGGEYQPPVNGSLRGDVGILYSDPNGATTVERIYRFNKSTSVVADIPSEIRLHPDAWGELKFIVE
ncbi:MAG: FlgD immunoglobulin-like domain containing protein [bacterium]